MHLLTTTNKSLQTSDSDDEEDDEDDSDSSDSESDDEEDSEESKSETAEIKTDAPATSNKRKADAEETEAPAKKTKTADGSEESSTLWVGNLTWNIDDNGLYEEFKKFEGLTSARIITDRETGKSRGFGYVDFSDAESAKKAYEEMTGAFVDDRELKLDFAGKKTQDKPQDRAADRQQRYGDTVSPESDTLFVGNLPWSATEESVSEFFNSVAQVQSLRLPTDQ